MLCYSNFQFGKGNTELVMFIFKANFIFTEWFSAFALNTRYNTLIVLREGARAVGQHCPYLHPSHPLEPGDGVTDGVHTHVAHVQLARWVGEHGEHIKLGLRFLGKKEGK